LAAADADKTQQSITMTNIARLLVICLTVVVVFSIESGTDTLQSVSAENVSDDPPSQEFCMDMPEMRMVMFLKGFRRSLASSKHMLPCLSYYVRSWVLNDEGKFKGAMIYSFLLGIVTQGLAVTRAIVFAHVKQPRVRKYLMVSIYVLQVYMGYMIMLVAMMYSVELLLSAVTGLACGYCLFHKSEAPHTTTRTISAERRSSEMREPLLDENRISTTD
jgi:hypothetical protein